MHGLWADTEAGVAAFKGLRYAEPPVGERRWRPPEPSESRSGVVSAREFGPRCPQDNAGVRYARRVAEVFGADPATVPELPAISEDCLFLNVWTSNLGGSEPQPVMVWIHGGSNRHGGGDERVLDGTSLARRGVVVVTFNYRLGLLGFLAHPALSAESPQRSSGNYGLLDQVAALEWVQRNIAAFGGDPSRVTLAGVSSGAADVLYLMTSPLAAGLFQRAIAQSGAPPSDERTLASQEIRGVRVQELLEIDGDETLEKMREMPAERLLEISSAHLNHEFDCAPVADGWAIPDLPGRVFAAGRQHDVDLLIGSNADEWTTLESFSEPLSPAGLAGWLRSHWGGWSERALEIYRAWGTAQVEEVARRWQTDRWFTCPARYVAGSMAAVPSDAFLYQFTRPVGGSAGPGAYHGAEVAYALDNLDAESWLARDPADRRLADAMAAYWVGFAAAGDPNGDGRPAWPPWSRSAREYLELGDEIAVRSGLREDACRIWEGRLVTQLGLR